MFQKIDSLLKRSKRRVPSFFSTLFASLFVAVSFLFLNWFIPFGQSNWRFNWFFLSIAILIYCIIYYFVGRKIILNLNPRELSGYNKNFIASVLTGAYILVVVLAKFKPIYIVIATLVLMIISILLAIIISSRWNRIFG